MSRDLFQNGDCRIAYSAIAALVKFLMSGSRESLLQHGWERAQHTQPLALRTAVWLRGDESNNVITVLAFEQERKLFFTTTASWIFPLP